MGGNVLILKFEFKKNIVFNCFQGMVLTNEFMWLRRETTSQTLCEPCSEL